MSDLENALNLIEDQEATIRELTDNYESAVKINQEWKSSFQKVSEELNALKLKSEGTVTDESEECEAKLAKATARIQEITNLVRTKIQELQGAASTGGRRFESSTDDSSFVLGGIRVSRGYDSQSSGRSSRSSSASSRTSKSSGSSRSTASSGAWSYGGRGVDFS
jgi:hypothetical protein